jgi:hypothetical protein
MKYKLRDLIRNDDDDDDDNNNINNNSCQYVNVFQSATANGFLVVRSSSRVLTSWY